MNKLRILREAMRKKAPSPLGALARGMIAGALGSAAQSLFFKVVKAPPPSHPRDESSLQTVARRTLEGLADRAPLEPEEKARAASVIHYLFGAAWGGLYGLIRESFRIPPQAFGALVWMASDNLLLPAFRVAKWPQHYTAREHRYALQAHVAYGAATAGAYAALRNLGPAPLRALPGLLALQLWAFALRSPPARLLRRRQPWHKRVINGVLVQRAALA